MNLRISNWIRCSLLCLLPAFGLLLAGCATTDDTNTTAKVFDVSVLHIGDTITVVLEGPPDISNQPHEESIKEDGSITLDSIGRIQAEGKKLGELQNDIYKAYVPAIYTHLNVTVKFTGERTYYVGGEVAHPGEQFYREGMTVTRAITAAGDFTDFANHSKTVLTRRADGKRVKVDCDAVRAGEAVDPPVYPGDQIYANKRSF
jgi:protein involved in polysaccharide export with SLBB domain